MRKTSYFKKIIIGLSNAYVVHLSNVTFERSWNSHKKKKHILAHLNLN